MSSAPGAARELASGKVRLEEPAPHLARLTLDNPERRNALDHEMLDALAETAATCEARCLLLTATGPVFSAGYDIRNLDPSNFEQAAEELVAHPFHRAIEAIEAFPFPTVAALQGHTIGGGLELALACDIRIAARGAKLGMPPAKLGLIYSHTGLRKFIETCGVANTAELFYVGRNVSTERALEIGLVNRIVEPGELEDAALGMATEIASNAPLSQAGNKRIIRALRDHISALPEDVERELVELRESCFRSEDFREGVEASAQNRQPEWKGR